MAHQFAYVSNTIVLLGLQSSVDRCQRYHFHAPLVCWLLGSQPNDMVEHTVCLNKEPYERDTLSTRYVDSCISYTYIRGSELTQAIHSAQLVDCVIDMRIG